MDAQVKLLLDRLAARVRDREASHFEERHKAMIARDAARGVKGGSQYREMDKSAAEVVTASGAPLLREAISQLRLIFGEVPTELIPSLREFATGWAEGTANGLTDRLARFWQQLGFPGKVQPEHVPRALSGAKRDIEIELAPLEIRARLFTPMPAPAGPNAEYDVFISHASEDKAEVAEPLARELVSRGLRVWLDKTELTIGDRLMSRIDEGLRRSRYGVVILSRDFLRKDWPVAELNALAALQATYNRKVILPVWHNLSTEDVIAVSPLLAATLGVSTARGLSAIADEIQKAIRLQEALDSSAGSAG